MQRIEFLPQYNMTASPWLLVPSGLVRTLLCTLGCCVSSAFDRGTWHLSACCMVVVTEHLTQISGIDVQGLCTEWIVHGMDTDRWS